VLRVRSAALLRRRRMVKSTGTSACALRSAVSSCVWLLGADLWRSIAAERVSDVGTAEHVSDVGAANAGPR
jgi:hypothetical protein